MRTVTVEEHFAPPGFLDGPARRLKEHTLARGAVGARIIEQLGDLDSKRLAEMDAAGIDMQVLSINAPGTEQLDAADAVKHYAAAERAGLDTADFWRDYGAMLNREGKYPEAETCLKKAVALKATSGEAEFQLALAEDRQGKYADAIGHYEASLAAMPDSPAALNNLALLYATATNADGIFPALNEVEGEGVMQTMVQELWQGKEVGAILDAAEARLRSIVKE